MILTDKSKAAFEEWFYNNYTAPNAYERIRKSEVDRFYLLADFVQQSFIIKWLDEFLNIWMQDFSITKDWQLSISDRIKFLNNELNNSPDLWQVNTRN